MVIFTLKAPLVVGDYPLVGTFFYGTETAAALSTRTHPRLGAQPLGGLAGRSGRIKFSESAVISVKEVVEVQPVAQQAP